ncbi:MAG: hypothetical protein ACO2PN_14560, partial [Pyrobaculum sp.]
VCYVVSRSALKFTWITYFRRTGSPPQLHMFNATSAYKRYNQKNTLGKILLTTNKLEQSKAMIKDRR